MSTFGNNIPAQYTTIETNNTKRMKISFSQSPEAGGSPWQFTVLFGNLPDFDKVQDVRLITCSITNTVPNVSFDQNNNVFSLDFSTAGVFSYTVPTGFYSFSSLATILQSQINAFIAPSTISISLDPAGYVTMVITGAETMKNNTNNTLGNTLGFITLGAFLPTLTAEVLPDLQGLTYFHIHSNTLGTNNCFANTPDGNIKSQPCLFSVPVSAAFGFQNVYQGSPLDRVVFGDHGSPSMRRFDIQLRDQNGRLLTDMDPRSVVDIVLKISY